MATKGKSSAGPKRSGWSFYGRAGRREFVLKALVYLFAGSVGAAMAVIGVLVGGAFTVLWLAVTTRRLHDMNRSGWWQVVPSIPFAAGVGLAALIHPPGAGLDADASIAHLIGNGESFDVVSVCVWASLILGLAFAVYLAVAPGTNGPNAYGEDH